MSDLQVLAVDGKLLYTFDFSEEVPSTSPLTTLSSVTYVLPSNTSPQELTSYTTSDSLSTYQSSIGLQGAVHGHCYQVQAKGTLSNGEVIVKNITVQGHN